MREEYEESSERELDIVIEDAISGHPIRIGIECRNYKRKQDKTWIDELIGKYRNLGVDKIVAVSSSGFTRGALEKAQRVGIRTLSMREALDTDLEQMFIKQPFVRFFGHAESLARARVEFQDGSPRLPAGEDIGNWLIVHRDGSPPGTVRNIALSLYADHSRAAVEEHIAETELLDPKDFVPREFDVTVSFGTSGATLIAPDGTRREIASVHLRIVGSTQMWDAEHQYWAYDKKVATVATLSAKAGRSHEVTFVQTAGERPTSLRYAYRLVDGSATSTPAPKRLPAKKKTAKAKNGRK